MTSIQTPWEWGIFRLAVGYAGLYRNFCNAFFSTARKKSVKCSLKWQVLWVALQLILYSIPSKEGLKKKKNWCSRHVTAYWPVNIHPCRFSRQHLRHVGKGECQKYYYDDGSTQGMFPLQPSGLMSLLSWSEWAFPSPFLKGGKKATEQSSC